ncbi:MAG: glycosyltransferase family 2 protein [Nitrospirae bacterium]|nr:glycosyltransferase family 2 protein [Nitrospirota bacterium]
MFKSSVIIPTYNRPEELKNCVKSLLEQTVKPYEIIIVDDGNLKELPFEKECKEAGIRYLYLKKDTPGLTASRNLGIKASTGDIIFFLDDDVVLYSDYTEKILAVYEEDAGGKIGGVGGAITNPKPLKLIQRLRRIVNIIFLISGFQEGKVLASGFSTNYGATGSPIRKKTEVDFLSGGVSSFRRGLFDSFAFDTGFFHKYRIGEDKEFTYRVSRKYKLIYTPDAKLLHMESPAMRPDDFAKGRMFVLFSYVFFTRYKKSGILSRLLFYYALSGYALSRAIVFVFSPNRRTLERLIGVLHGIKEIFSGEAALVV